MDYLRMYRMFYDFKESCGVLYEDGTFLKCRNTSPSPYDSFVMPGTDYSRAERAGKIVGLIHTHTSSIDHEEDPSDDDYRMIKQPEAGNLKKNVIISTFSGRFVFYNRDGVYKRHRIKIPDAFQYLNGCFRTFRLAEQFIGAEGIISPEYDRQFRGFKRFFTKAETLLETEYYEG